MYRHGKIRQVPQEKKIERPLKFNWSRAALNFLRIRVSYARTSNKRARPSFSRELLANKKERCNKCTLILELYSLSLIHLVLHLSIAILHVELYIAEMSKERSNNQDQRYLCTGKRDRFFQSAPFLSFMPCPCNNTSGSLYFED